MSLSLPDHVLDHQLLVAWAGETGRLSWWRVDATDPLGGGDFFRRWLPRTAPAAGLDAARRSAILVDAEARAQAAGTRDQDDLVTLFHVGADLDRQIEERLRFRRAQGTLTPPVDAFNPRTLAARIRVMAPSPRFVPVPGGRRIQMDPGTFTAAHADALLLALLDEDGFPARYPLPFIDRRRAA